MEFEEKKDPKKEVVDIKFKLPDNPSPNPKERVYILRVDLFNGFELPESISKGCIHITCGPYKDTSSVVTVKNCCATWNHVFSDIKITAPVEIEEVFDIIIYLATSAKAKDRICFLRIPAKDVLYSKDDKMEIKKWTLVEDICKDEIGDEEFPGILNMRLTFFDKNPPRRPKHTFPPESEMHKYYEDYMLRVFLYMGRDLPAADDTGLADPFIILRCAGEKIQSITKKETLNPGWFQTLQMKIRIPIPGSKIFPTPSVSLLCYDEDSFGRKDLLGRSLMLMKGGQKSIEENNCMVHYEIYQEAEWHELYFDALKEHKGFILAGFGLLTEEEAENNPPPSIVPPSIPSTLNVICIGIRDLIDSIDIVPLKRLSLKFDVSGDSQEAMDSNKHPVKYNSCNVLEIISVPIDIPLNPLYSPVCSVYVYDHVLGFIGSRLIGICHIPLDKVVKRTLKEMLDRNPSRDVDMRFDNVVRFVETDKDPEGKQNPQSIKNLDKIRGALNKLQLLVDEGLVDLAVEDEDTDEEAIFDALKEMQQEEAEAQAQREKEESEDGQKYDIGASEQEESEEEYYSEDDYYSGDYSNNSDDEEENNNEYQSTLRSNDIALGFEDDDDSEDNNDFVLERNESIRPRLSFEHHVSSPSPQKMGDKQGAYSTNLNKLTNRSSKEVKKQKDKVKNEQYMSMAARKAEKKKIGGNKRIDESVLEKDIDKKKEIQKKLTGFDQRKDKLKKMAQQKMQQKKFKEDVRMRDLKNTHDKQQQREKDQEKLKNAEKRRKLATKPNKYISLQAEDTDPNEDFDMTPEYLIGRETYEDELEDRIIKKKPYYKQNVMKGQCRGVKGWFFKKVANTQEITGLFKCISVIQTPDTEPEQLQK